MPVVNSQENFLHYKKQRSPTNKTQENEVIDKFTIFDSTSVVIPNF